MGYYIAFFFFQIHYKSLSKFITVAIKLLYYVIKINILFYIVCTILKELYLTLLLKSVIWDIYLLHTDWTIAWYSEHDSFGSPSHKHFCFIQNVKEYRFINYPVIFPNLLAAWNLLLVVKFWFTDDVITKRLTAPLPWKVKKTVKSLHPTS